MKNKPFSSHAQALEAFEELHTSFEQVNLASLFDGFTNNGPEFKASKVYNSMIKPWMARCVNLSSSLSAQDMNYLLTMEGSFVNRGTHPLLTVVNMCGGKSSPSFSVLKMMLAWGVDPCQNFGNNQSLLSSCVVFKKSLGLMAVLPYVPDAQLRSSSLCGDLGGTFAHFLARRIGPNWPDRAVSVEVIKIMDVLYSHNPDLFIMKDNQNQVPYECADNNDLSAALKICHDQQKAKIEHDAISSQVSRKKSSKTNNKI